MAFAAGSMLISALYFFHFGILQAWSRSTHRLDLNEQAEVALERLVRDLRMVYSVTEFRPHLMVFNRLPSEPVDTRVGFSQDNLRLVQVRYEFKKTIKGSFVLERTERQGNPEVPVLEVADGDSASFVGYVYEMPTGKDDPVPKYKEFDPITQGTSELSRITLVRIHLNLKQGKENAQLVGKVFMPVAFNRVLQADWSVE